MMTSLKIFFEAYKYLNNCVQESLKTINRDSLRTIFEILIEAREKGASIIVDGQGRSLQSALIMEDSLEHNGFPIIFPVSNPNLRPWSKGDIFFFNSGSGGGSPVTHAQAAAKDGLKILGMTYNAEVNNMFKGSKSGILTLIPSMNRNQLYAPLGTEFEFASAVIGACIGYGVGKNASESIKEFDKSSQTIVDLFNSTVSFYENNLDALIEFINIIKEYLKPSTTNKVYFRGVGRDAIINQVCAIRYGHLHKMEEGKVIKDLQVIAEGHWDLRKEGDLAIITSGSGSTSQTLDYAMQAFISGLKVFGITSFEDSDLGRFTKRADGCLVVPGRHAPFSMYNVVSSQRTSYLPEFELNCYLTMDSLLAQIASDNGITEADMKASHRLKTLE